MVETGPDIFGTVAIRADNIAPFPKWRDALERYFTERAQPQKSVPQRLVHELQGGGMAELPATPSPT